MFFGLRELYYRMVSQHNEIITEQQEIIAEQKNIVAKHIPSVTEFILIPSEHTQIITEHHCFRRMMIPHSSEPMRNPWKAMWMRWLNISIK